MSDTNTSNCPGFLTPGRKRMFWSAIEAHNNHHQELVRLKRHVYDHVSNRGKAFNTREWSIAHIKEAFTTDVAVRPFDVNGINGLVFDDQVFVYFRKIEDTNYLCPEPKTIQTARHAQLQQPLPGTEFESLKTTQDQLRDLSIFLAGYRTNAGLIIGLSFIDRNGDQIISEYELEQVSTVRTTQHEEKVTTKPRFRSKTENHKKESS
ncbi:MAG: hypothetical protein JNJ61_20295 [Anaerolineae bacterium]|nr:hypothetical protein [Anaerolineae bacterium]